MHVWFIYISLGFLGVALYRADYLVVPPVQSFPLLIMSLVLLYFGFVADAVSWQRLLRAQGLAASLRRSVASCGLSIFGKYIPGKLWIIVGRAGYIAGKCGAPMGRVTVVALQAQALVILVGLGFSVVTAVAIDALRDWMSVIIVSCTALALVLFNLRLNQLSTRLIRKILPRKQLSISRVVPGAGITVVPWVVLTWLFFSLGFYCLALSLSPSAPFMSAFAFPFAATVGILAIVVPGGLGVREGLLTLCLVGFGLALVDAASIAVFARLWFLVGEGAFFLTALGVARDPAR